MINRAITLIYNSVKDRVDLTLEQFAEALKDWNFVELESVLGRMNGKIESADATADNQDICFDRFRHSVPLSTSVKQKSCRLRKENSTRDDCCPKTVLALC